MIRLNMTTTAFLVTVAATGAMARTSNSSTNTIQRLKPTYLNFFKGMK
jgi:hypothetical protein